MREIRHNKPGVRSEKPKEHTRREFFRIGGGGLLAGLAATSCVGSLIVPKKAHAEAQQRRTPRVITLDRPLAELDRATQPYRQAEVFPNERTPQYSNAVVLPREVGFIVAINNREDRRGLNITLGSREPLRADLNSFARMVRDTSRHALNRVKIILDRGSEQVDGREVPYTNAYVLPIDSQGNAITGLGEGRYLIYGASKSGDRVGGASPYILQEPENRHTVAVLQR